jgi:type I restriction enzyme S subunit
MNADRLLALYERVADAPDTIARLRRFVLDLAVRGKLVAQDPADEPAAALLKRIAVERDRMLSAGEIKAKKPILPVERSDRLYDIPRSWHWARFNAVAAIQSNLVDPKRYLDMPHIAPDNIESWTARLLPYVTVKEAGVFSGKHLFSAGSILYSKIRPNLAKVTVADFDGLCSADMYPVRAHINRDFLVKFMITEAFVAQSVSADNRVAMPKINQTALSNILVPLPPLAEQRRIVAKVDELMALLDRLEAARAAREAARDRLTTASLTRLTAPADPETARAHARFALDMLPALTTRPDQIRTLRQTILNLAVRGKLVEQDPADEPAAELLKRIATERNRLLGIGKIKKQKPILPIDQGRVPYQAPLRWQWARFNEVGAIQSNLVDPKRYPDMPHIAPDNIESWTAKLLPYTSVREAGVFSGKHLFSAGSILYSKIRPNLAKVTVVDFDGLCSADMYPVHAHIYREFLLNFMITKEFVEQTIAEDNRVAMPKINQDALSNILIPVPPLAEQHRIVAKVDALMALCDRLEAALADADAARQRLLEALLHEALAPAAPALEAAE